MIKRDTIQRCIMVDLEDDGQGGSPTEMELKEIVQAHVSQTSINKSITAYGVKEQLVINVATNIKLDESDRARYLYSGKLFKILKQAKSGNEYFSILAQVNE